MKRAQPRWAGLLLAALSGCLMVSLACAQSLQVIDLKHRTAHEVIPVLQPLLEPGGALSGQDYKLFVRASSANTAQLREALAQIDRAPRQLLVSVRRATQADIEHERASVSGALAGERGSVSVNQPPAVGPASAGRVTVRATSESSGSSSSGVASVAVLEGSSAFISTGASVPMITGVAGGVGRRSTWGATSTAYRDIATGFLVTPRMNGQTVVLEIEQRDEAVRNGRIETQNLATQVTTRVGEWAQLGGVSESVSAQSRGLASGAHQTRSDERSIWVRVEVQ